MNDRANLRARFKLELCWHGMMEDLANPGDMIGANDRETISIVDVELRIHYPLTGEVETLAEWENKPIAEADELFAKLVDIFPEADQNIWPE